MRSLKDLSDEGFEQLWANEAVRRNTEIDAGTASLRDAEEVFRDARDQISKG
jgi:Putative addiction module component